MKKQTHTIASYKGMNFSTHCGLNIHATEIDTETVKTEVIDAGATRREIRKINCVECMKNYLAQIVPGCFGDYSKIQEEFAAKLETVKAEVQSHFYNVETLENLKKWFEALDATAAKFGLTSETVRDFVVEKYEPGFFELAKEAPPTIYAIELEIVAPEGIPMCAAQFNLRFAQQTSDSSIYRITGAKANLVEYLKNCYGEDETFFNEHAAEVVENCENCGLLTDDLKPVRLESVGEVEMLCSDCRQPFEPAVVTPGERAEKVTA